MIKEIINKYGEFSDSWISEIKCTKNYNIQGKIIEIILTCANKENDLKYETIKLIFKDIVFFEFLEINDSDNFTSGDVLIKVEEGCVLFDFYPIDYFNYLEENPESNFKIKCKKVEYFYISEYVKIL